MFYTVNKISKIAGISVRTLHYYDEIGLLKPSRIKANGYREYDENGLLRLQQILFFKELEFSLDDIKYFMLSNFDVEMILKDQMNVLKLKRERIDKLINTMNMTMKRINKESKIKEDELYSSFSTKKIEEYKKEAKNRWGETKAFKESEEKLKNMGQQELETIQNKIDLLMKDISSKMDLSTSSKETQELINKHYNSLRNFYEPTIEIYSGLADLYLTDKRFNKYFEKYKKGFAKYMHDAMKIYCENNKKTL